MLHRDLKKQIQDDLKNKMVFLGGPRQVGKTTLAKSLGTKASYLNWDIPTDRKRILKSELPTVNLWIFDEIHKYKQWRNYLKGIYDQFGNEKEILVTGSARLDLLRRGGDSLQGRYHFLRLYPLTIDELKLSRQNEIEDLMKLSGFPEPYLSASQQKSERWSNEYRQRILQEDILSVESIEELGKAEHLLIELPDYVGSPLSLNSLREDLDVSFKAVKRWIDIFERFYALFLLQPFHAQGLRGLKKERKHYHYDWSLVQQEGFRFENMMAVHLLKIIHEINDRTGKRLELRYFRDLDQREVDFVICEGKKVILFAEAKLSSDSVDKSLTYIKKKFKAIPCFQVNLRGQKEFTNAEGVEVLPVQKFIHKAIHLCAP